MDDDIDLASDNNVGGGIWSDGATIWVSEERDTNPKLFAYVLDGGDRVEGRDFNTLQAAGASLPTGLWSDGETMWVAYITENKSKVYAFNQPPAANDPTLSSLTVSPKDIVGFAADRTSYDVGVASTVTEATITATATNSNADVFFDPPDAVSTTPGYQVALSAGRNTVTLTVTAEDDVTEQEYTVSVNRGVTDDYGWKAENDLDQVPQQNEFDTVAGVTGHSTTLWVSTRTSSDLLAYRQDGTRDESRDITVTVEVYAWTDGNTLWTSQTLNRNLLAYQLSDGARQQAKDLQIHSTANPRGIWSNGTTMWIVDFTEHRVYAYRLSDSVRQAGMEFSLHASNARPSGIWSDGATMWVADSDEDKVFAYRLSDGDRQSGRDFNTLADAGNTQAAGIWSDDNTMWIADSHKVFSYNMPPSNNANLSSLTVGPKDIIGFAPDRTSYEVGVAGSVGTATITAAADHPAATIGFSATDAEPGTPGHQVSLSVGRNAVTVTVTAEDGSTRAYTITINRGVNSQYGWKADDDLDGLIAAGNRGPRGIWANSTTFYISDFDNDKVYAYNRDGTRDDTKDFDTTGSTFPNGIWSDGTTLWVADSASTTLFAYTLSNGNRNTGAEITLLNGARGVWGNSTTIWAVNDTTDKLEAYQRSDGTDDNDKDITLHADNGDPAGIWSDDTTIWVADHGEDQLFAYTLSGGARDMTKEIDTSTSGNENPRGLWGEGDTIWVTDEDDDRVYSYNLQDNRSSDATLSALTTSPRNILRFDADRTAYEVGVASTVAQATVTATANDANARVSYSGTDADLVADGHQVALSAGRNQVTVTVTAENDSTKTYRVRINRGVDTPYGWKAEHDLDGLVLATALDRPQGITGDGGIFWVSSVFSRDLLAYRQDGQRVPSRDFTAHIDNQSSNYLWNDGETIWVPDQDDDKLYAYRLSDGARQTDREFDLHTNNTAPTGIWSDGITVWVADSADTKLYAYALDGGARQESKEFDLDSSNQLPGGIWSDGLTIWVADESTDRLHAYDLANGSPQPTRDFTTLSAAQNRDSVDIWSDGTTMWVVDYDDEQGLRLQHAPRATTPG